MNGRCLLRGHSHADLVSCVQNTEFRLKQVALDQRNQLIYCARDTSGLSHRFAPAPGVLVGRLPS